VLTWAFPGLWYWSFATRLDELAQNIRDCGGRAITCATDVARREDLERLVGRAVAEFGRLDVLVSWRTSVT
jgi:NAD(P)-dependent dehydrogenase (short-subunit alcohol dehydrogenase family)